MSEDPIKRFVLLVLFQAQQDRATELLIAPTSGGMAPIKYKVDGTWYDLSQPPSHIFPDVMTELERLANLSKGAKEGEIDTAFSGVRLRWRIMVADGNRGFVLTPVAR
jgi:type II secretory ATPase GspE/PulE/Tfp pilus assembly ATPase PilB-like protein